MTEWRRGRDSNPRDPFGPNGFQDRRFQPLTHPSGRPSLTGKSSYFQQPRNLNAHIRIYLRQFRIYDTNFEPVFGFGQRNG